MVPVKARSKWEGKRRVRKMPHCRPRATITKITGSAKADRKNMISIKEMLSAISLIMADMMVKSAVAPSINSAPRRIS